MFTGLRRTDVNQRQHDMASIKHRNRQQIQNREVYVENYAEP